MSGKRRRRRLKNSERHQARKGGGEKAEGAGEREKEREEVAAKGVEGPSGCGGERENGHTGGRRQKAL